MSVVIEVDCSRSAAAPLTTSMIEPLKTKAMENPNPLIDDYYAVEYQDISLDSIEIDGEKAANVVVGGSTGVGEVGWVEHIIVTNHDNKKYEIHIHFSGDEGISGFGNIYTSLEEQILDSIQCIN